MTARAHRNPGRAGDGNTTFGAPPATPAPVSVFRFFEPTGDGAALTDSTGLLGDAWKLYLDAFTVINTRAAQRHLMTWAEFDDVTYNERIEKYVAMAGSRLVGLSVLIDDLEAWPLVAPEFFEQKFPGRKVFYVGFVATDATPGVYAELVSAMYERVIAADGIAVMDFCGENVDDLLIARRVDVLLRRINPHAKKQLADRQEFWAWDFREGDDA